MPGSLLSTKAVLDVTFKSILWSLRPCPRQQWLHRGMTQQMLKSSKFEFGAAISAHLRFRRSDTATSLKIGLRFHCRRRVSWRRSRWTTVIRDQTDILRHTGTYNRHQIFAMFMIPTQAYLKTRGQNAGVLNVASSSFPDWVCSPSVSLFRWSFVRQSLS
jgi:hypothetical protein